MTHPGHEYVFRIILLAAVTILLPSASCVHGSRQRTVSEIIQAYGGKDSLANITAISAKGRIITFMQPDEGAYFRIFKRPLMLYVDISYAERTEKRILQGDRGFEGDAATVSPVIGAAYDAMVYQYDQLDLPFGLVDKSLIVQSLRRDTLQGRPVDILKLADRTGHELKAVVDADRHLIVRVSGSIAMGTNSSALRADFSDFKSVGGVLLPFHIINYADDVRISETEITGYEINPVVSDSLFSP